MNKNLHLKNVSRRAFLGICGGIAAGSALGEMSPASQKTTAFRAGAAVCDITPEEAVSLAGHFQDRLSTHAHDRLYARCIVLNDGATTLALTTVDSCMVLRETLDAAKARAHALTGIPVENMLISATHTHTAPTSASVFQSDPVPGYAETLAAGIATAIRDARDRLAPAEIAWGAGAVPDEVFNRRWFVQAESIPANPFGETTDQVRMNPPRASEALIQPAGPTDPETPVIAVRHRDGRPMAIYANYSLHYVGGTDAGAISADYFGCFADALTRMVQPGDASDFVAMLSNGTSGDVNNINFREAGTAYAPYEKMREVAEKVAAEVHRVYQELAFHEHAVLGAVCGTTLIGVRKPDNAAVTRAQAIVNGAEETVMRTSEEVYARETLLLQHYPDQAEIPLQVLRVGDAAIAAIPCEVFAEIGLKIKVESPFPRTIAVSLANGYNGYLPTAAQHALGGYETWRARSSYLAVDAADIITERLGDMLGDMRQA